MTRSASIQECSVALPCLRCGSSMDAPGGDDNLTRYTGICMSCWLKEFPSKESVDEWLLKYTIPNLDTPINIQFRTAISDAVEPSFEYQP